MYSVDIFRHSSTQYVHIVTKYRTGDWELSYGVMYTTLYVLYWMQGASALGLINVNWRLLRRAAEQRISHVSRLASEAGLTSQTSSTSDQVCVCVSVCCVCIIYTQHTHIYTNICTCTIACTHTHVHNFYISKRALPGACNHKLAHWILALYNLYKVQSVYNNNVTSWSLHEELRRLSLYIIIAIMIHDCIYNRLHHYTDCRVLQKTRLRVQWICNWSNSGHHLLTHDVHVCVLINNDNYIIHVCVPFQTPHSMIVLHVYTLRRILYCH